VQSTRSRSCLRPAFTPPQSYSTPLHEAKPSVLTIINVFVIDCLTLPVEMPSSDYSSAIGGGLKLKGAKDAGIKKKKKKKSKPAEPTNSKVEEKSSDDTALQNALADEETSLEASGVEREGETKQYGKTEAQKRHDERRRKRVRILCASREFEKTHLTDRVTA